MTSVRNLTCAAAVMLFLCMPVSHAAGRDYIAKDAVDLIVLLAPPPGPNDPGTVADLNELRWIQATRSAERVSVAKADVIESVFRLMTVLDRPLTPEQLPKTAAFFRKLTTDGAVSVAVAKRGFARPRPYVVAKDLEPVCPLATNYAYPSGHTTVGYLMGIVLAAMIPEQRDRIFVRTQEFGESRLVCGVHYPTDVEAGRIAGTVLAAVAMNNADYQRDFAAARAELRAALGL